MGAVTFDPADRELMRDPYETLARLRETEPVHWSPALSGWVVTSYGLVNEVVTQPDPFSADRLGNVGARLSEPERATVADVMRWLGLWMVFRDPPDHTRIRRHLMKVVSPKVLRAQDDSIRRLADDLLDTVEPGSTFDVYRDFGLQLPGLVTMDLLGVPRDRLRDVKSWSDDMMLFIGSARSAANKYDRARNGADLMAALFRELIELRRRDPADDVLTTLIGSRIDDDGSPVLTDDELVASMMMIANGAQETTAQLISNALLALDAHPDASAFVRSCSEAEMAVATEEFLRYDGSVFSTARLVTADCELGDRRLAAGDRVFAVLIAANRDPDTFESPNDLVLDRSPNPHLSFSRGAHFCLGAPLARLEAQLGLRALLQRFPHIDIAEPVDEIPWIDSMVARGPSRLPIHVR